jgi:hypothetical protein
MTIIFSILALIIGFTCGSHYWTKHFGHSWFTRTLTNDEALIKVWELFHAPKGGVAYTLQQERAEWEAVPPSMYAALIRHQIRDTKVRMRTSGVVLVLIGIVFCVASTYSSFAVLGTFLCAMIAPAPLCKYEYSARAFAVARAKCRLFEVPVIDNKNTFAIQALVDLFRPVRLWMEADIASLSTRAEELKIDAIVRVIDAEEAPSKRPILSKPSPSDERQCDVEVAYVLTMAGYNFQVGNNIEVGLAASWVETELRREKRRWPTGMKAA